MKVRRNHHRGRLIPERYRDGFTTKLRNSRRCFDTPTFPTSHVLLAGPCGSSKLFAPRPTNCPGMTRWLLMRRSPPHLHCWQPSTHKLSSHLSPPHWVLSTGWSFSLIFRMRLFCCDRFQREQKFASKREINNRLEFHLKLELLQTHGSLPRITSVPEGTDPHRSSPRVMFLHYSISALTPTDIKPGSLFFFFLALWTPEDAVQPSTALNLGYDSEESRFIKARQQISQQPFLWEFLRPAQPLWTSCFKTEMCGLWWNETWTIAVAVTFSTWGCQNVL